MSELSPHTKKLLSESKLKAERLRAIRDKNRAITSQHLKSSQRAALCELSAQKLIEGVNETILDDEKNRKKYAEQVSILKKLLDLDNALTESEKDLFKTLYLKLLSNRVIKRNGKIIKLLEDL